MGNGAVSGGITGHVEVLDLANAKPGKILHKEPGNGMISVAMSADGKRASPFGVASIRPGRGKKALSRCGMPRTASSFGTRKDVSRA